MPSPALLAMLSAILLSLCEFVHAGRGEDEAGRGGRRYRRSPEDAVTTPRALLDSCLQHGGHDHGTALEVLKKCTASLREFEEFTRHVRDDSQSKNEAYVQAYHKAREMLAELANKVKLSQAMLEDHRHTQAFLDGQLKGINEEVGQLSEDGQLKISNGDTGQLSKQEDLHHEPATFEDENEEIESSEDQVKAPAVGMDVQVTQDATVLEKECHSSTLSWPDRPGANGGPRADMLGLAGQVKKVDLGDLTVGMDFEEKMTWVPIRALKGFESFVTDSEKQKTVLTQEGGVEQSVADEPSDSLLDSSPSAEDSVGELSALHEQSQTRSRSRVQQVSLDGFNFQPMNTQYSVADDAHMSVGGSPTYWSQNGLYFLYFCREKEAWLVASRDSLRDNRDSGACKGRGAAPSGRDILAEPNRSEWLESDANRWVSRPSAGVASLTTTAG